MGTGGSPALKEETNGLLVVWLDLLPVELSWVDCPKNIGGVYKYPHGGSLT